MRAGEVLPAGTEHRADITEPRGREHRVTQCVCRDVAVGMSRATVAVRPVQPGDPAVTVRFDRMDVRALTYPHAPSAVRAAAGGVHAHPTSRVLGGGRRRGG